MAPGVFVAVSLVAAVVEPGYSIVDDHLSGLASTAATTRWAMTAAFVVLGAGVGTLAAALRHHLGGMAIPAVLTVAAACVVAIGLFPRSCVETACVQTAWHDTAHDVVSVPAYAALLALPLLVARHRAEVGPWAVRGLVVVGVVAALVTVLALDPGRSGSGIVQRSIAGLPLLWLAGLTVHLDRTARTGEGRGAVAPRGYARTRSGL